MNDYGKVFQACCFLWSPAADSATDPAAEPLAYPAILLSPDTPPTIARRPQRSADEVVHAAICLYLVQTGLLASHLLDVSDVSHPIETVGGLMASLRLGCAFRPRGALLLVFRPPEPTSSEGHKSENFLYPGLETGRGHGRLIWVCLLGNASGGRLRLWSELIPSTADMDVILERLRQLQAALAPLGLGLQAQVE